MSYATVEDIQARRPAEMSEQEQNLCKQLLEDAAIIIDAYNERASDEAKFIATCRMVIRTLGDGLDSGVPLGATQGSMSALGYSQSWTIGSGTSGELYLGKLEKKLLGVGNKIGASNPYAQDDVRCCL